MTSSPVSHVMQAFPLSLPELTAVVVVCFVFVIPFFHFFSVLLKKFVGASLISYFFSSLFRTA